MAIAIAAVAIERGRARAASRVAGTIPEWIWADGDPRAVTPLAFLAARDVVVPDVPIGAAIEVVGDPEFVLYLNGARVGSDAASAALRRDRFDVTGLLRAGRNRIVVECRAPTGTGGVWLRLVAADGRVLAVSDRSWTVYRNFWHGVLGDRALFPSEPARSWGATPAGRWRAVADPVTLPTFEASFAGSEIRAARRWRTAGSGSRFRPLSAAPRSRKPLGSHVEFDFGSEICGYAQIDTRGSAGGAALVGFGAATARGARARADEIAVLLPGRDWWQAATPRCARYLTVAGLGQVAAASMIGVTSENFALLAAPLVRWSGLLGLTPPPSRTPVEDIVRRELEGGTSLAGRQ